MQSTFDKNQLAQNYHAVKSAINQLNKAYRADNPAALLAVSKTKPAQMIERLFALGQQDFGENYLQEAITKMDELKHLPIVWHYIGSIQRNKTRDIAKYFDWVHTLEREVIATRLNEQRAGMSPLNVLIQVNIDDEESKSGCQINELPALVEQVRACKNLRLRGLMIIPNKEGGDAFARTKMLFDDITKRYPSEHWDTLSMGMSGDMAMAIEQGSTMVRVGSAIFGEREYPNKAS